MTDFIKLTNNNGLEVVLCTKGASIYSIKFNDTLLTLTPTSKNKFLNSPQFFGKTLGQIAGRLLKRQTINGEEIILGDVNNEKEFILHGDGLNSISFKDFEFTTEALEDLYRINFTLEVENNIGLPGVGKFTIIYDLYKNENKLTITQKYLNEESDSLVSLSNHVYWNFGGDDIRNYSLYVNADKIASCNDELLILDEPYEIKYPLDFRRSMNLNTVISDIENSSIGTIDNCLLFDVNSQEEAPKAILENNEIRLSVYTSYPAANIYLCNVNDKCELEGISSEFKYTGLAIEPQQYILDNSKVYVSKGNEVSNTISFVIDSKLM